MINGYIIYKYSDYDEVLRRVVEIQRLCDRFEPLILHDLHTKNWKRPARKKIGKADCAIYFVSAASLKSDNVDWELSKFIKAGKPIYTVRLDSFQGYNEILYRKRGFGNLENINRERYMYSKEVTQERLVKYLQNNLEMDIGEEILRNADMSPEILIEQYKAYLQTSEDVVERRQSVSKFYITVNAAILSVLSTVIAVINALQLQDSAVATVVSCMIVPFLGFVLCGNWRRLVSSYGDLNAAKMTVIAAIEKNLPFDIYDVEWRVQTDRLGKKKYTSFTRIEKVIPLLFIILYACVFISAVVFLILTWI